jgi:paraquat-inducible protein B
MPNPNALQGGVQFDVFGVPGGAIADEAEFELFANERAAHSVSLPVRIAFENGQGLLARQTQLRYRGVPVGLVEEVNPSNSKVEVVARLEPGYDILRREGTIFSLVRPRIYLEGVSGLESLVRGCISNACREYGLSIKTMRPTLRPSGDSVLRSTLPTRKPR